MKSSSTVLVALIFFLTPSSNFAGNFNSRRTEAPVETIATTSNPYVTSLTEGHQITDPEDKVVAFILSDVAPYRMNYTASTRFCQSKRRKLPTQQQLQALVRALHAGGTYDPDWIADFKVHNYWTSTQHPSSSAYRFYLNGARGEIDYAHLTHAHSVRCVVPATDEPEISHPDSDKSIFGTRTY